MGVDLPSAIGNGSSIEGVLQQVLPRHSIGPAPLQRPLGGAFSQANPELNVVLHQIAQECMQRPKVLKLTKDQPHHRLDLFVRIMPDPAGRGVDIPNGECKAQRPRRAFCKVP
jgi:hypothetical protein